MLKRLFRAINRPDRRERDSSGVDGSGGGGDGGRHDDRTSFSADAGDVGRRRRIGFG